MAKLVIVTAAVALLCSGCGTYWQRQAESVYDGQPKIDDQAFLLHDANDLPDACKGQSAADGANSWTNATDSGQAKIRACTFAMKLLIDIRWAHYADALHGTVAYGSMGFDTVTLGLNTAGALTPGNANQILSAVAAGVGGLKTKIDEDILYKNSVQLILLQMRKDRATQANIILTSLKNNTYRTMAEAAIDLYAYNRAGSWTDALVSMDADSGNNAADSQDKLQTTQLGTAQTVTTAPVTTPPAAATTRP